MELYLNNETDYVLSPEIKGGIEAVIEVALELEEFEQDVEVSLTIVDNEEIKVINKNFRAIDKATDVLSFPMLDVLEDGSLTVGEENLNEDGQVVLGDIIISYEKALEQSKSYNHSEQREFAFLVAHSMLHLLGYDHMETEEEEVMIEKQKKIMEKVGINR